MPPSSLSEGELAVLALHGRGQDPAFMLDIIQQLGWEDKSVVFPAAADQCWYPEGFMAPFHKNKEDLEDALQTLAYHHQKLNEAGFSNDRIIIMGFSQGACLASHYALLNPDKYHALIILTGGFVGDAEKRWDFKGNFQQTPVFITTSEVDEWVPASRTRETAQHFSAMNAHVVLKIYKDRPHEVCKDEIAIIAGLN